jgi:hypothetical protein
MIASNLAITHQTQIYCKAFPLYFKSEQTNLEKQLSQSLKQSHYNEYYPFKPQNQHLRIFVQLESRVLPS